MAASTKSKFFTSLFLFAYFHLSSGQDESKLITLNESTWQDLLDGEWMVKFYAPWCPACRSFAPKWEEFAGKAAAFSVKVASVDVTINPALSGRFFITSLPTIYHVKDGVFRQYKGSRSVGELITLIRDKKYEEIEPLAWYQQPGSIPMELLSWFFKASMIVRNVHERMTNEYGIPVWGSYILFAVFTVVMGLLFGLIIVCFCDCICPPAPYREPPRSADPPNDKKVEEFLKNEKDSDADDVIEDDREKDDGDKEDKDEEGHEGLRQRKNVEKEEGEKEED
ncbi:thioredoxin-related transmembrane protein 1-like [Lineus longissimus]|uniref:thioredoxin-related transmembrane protein 1-like n=1 Tax=Lineus longissimus TaxID=88925 RepID=UPI002B4D268F